MTSALAAARDKATDPRDTSARLAAASRLAPADLIAAHNLGMCCCNTTKRLYCYSSALIIGIGAYILNALDTNIGTLVCHICNFMIVNNLEVVRKLRLLRKARKALGALVCQRS